LRFLRFDPRLKVVGPLLLLLLVLVLVR